jgi:hypothetical protein
MPPSLTTGPILARANCESKTRRTATEPPATGPKAAGPLTRAAC